MEATNLEHGNPVSAAARRLLHLHQHNVDTDTTIYSYFPATGAFPRSMTSTNIVSLPRLHAAKLGSQRLGFYPHKIRSHSLCSGGSMTLHQAHIPGSTIKIIGQWHSDDFLISLQGWVATFTKGVATAMAKISWFYHQVAPPCTPAES